MELDTLSQYEVALQVKEHYPGIIWSDKGEDYFNDVSTDIGELNTKLSEIIATDSASSVKSDSSTVSVIDGLKTYLIKSFNMSRWPSHTYNLKLIT